LVILLSKVELAENSKMTNGNGKSNTFLLGQIYERTEALPQIEKDISCVKTDLKTQAQKTDYRFKEVHGRINRVKKRSGGNIGVDFVKWTIRLAKKIFI